MISHDLKRGLALADQVMIMASGAVMYHAPASEVADVAEFQAVYERCTRN
jgi:ABC-type cobalamin/Fe3+-siderophores transport system ATPase subunit